MASCFSPLFYNENWQLLTVTLEVYRYFGVSLQVFYVQSIIDEIFAFLKVTTRLEKFIIKQFSLMNERV